MRFHAFNQSSERFISAAGHSLRHATEEANDQQMKQALCIYSGGRLAQAATGDELLAGEPAGIIRGQEDGDGGDVARSANASERGLCDEGFLEVGADHAGVACAFGIDRARVERVDADLLRTEFAREHAGNGIERSLGADVEDTARRGDAADHRADVDDATAFPQEFDGGIRNEQQPEHVDVEVPVEAFIIEWSYCKWNGSIRDV